MVEPEQDKRTDPVLQPRLVRFLRERPKLVEFGMREKALESVERNIAERRTPEIMADRFAMTAESITRPVMRDAARDRLENANEGILENF